MWKHSSNGYTGWFCSSSMAKGDIVCEGEKTTTVKIRNVYKQIADGLEVNKNAVKASIMEWLENLKKIVRMPEEDLVRVDAPELAYVSAERVERVQERFKSTNSNGTGK